jgi:hypothetical protein
MSDLVPHPSPAAARMRLHRDRRRRGLRCLMIELRETEIDALIGKRLLNSETRNDPGAVCDAIYLISNKRWARAGDAKQLRVWVIMVLLVLANKNSFWTADIMD